MIIVNPDKAKAIWKDKWREARKPLLASLDIEFMRAVESADIDKQYNNLIELFKIENIKEQSTCSIFIWMIYKLYYHYYCNYLHQY